jgi:hypothetical protein
MNLLDIGWLMEGHLVMRNKTSANSSEEQGEEDEEYYEDDIGENRMLIFMFGNVDDDGELDVDYLDEDAKEHISCFGKTSLGHLSLILKYMLKEVHQLFHICLSKIMIRKMKKTQQPSDQVIDGAD